MQDKPQAGAPKEAVSQSEKDNEKCFEQLTANEAPQIDVRTFKQPQVEDATILGRVPEGTRKEYEIASRRQRKKRLKIN